MKKIILAAVAVSGVLGVSAKTLYWKKTVASGDFASAANWTTDSGNATPATVGPEPGDTLYFALTQAAEITGTAFDTGNKQLKFVLSGNKWVTSKVPFTGSGSLAFEGWQGGITLSVASTHTGGVSVSQKLGLNIAATDALGTGTLSISNSGSATDGVSVRVDRGGAITITNAINITGNNYVPAVKGDTPNTFYICYGATLSGKLTSTCDFLPFNAWGTHSFSGDIEAPGKTCYVRFNGAEKCTFSGKVNASVVRYPRINTNGSSEHPGDLILSGDCSAATAETLATYAYTNVLASTAIWGGSVMASNETAVIRVDAATCLSSETSDVHLWCGGKISVNFNGALGVRKLFVDGVEKPAGLYTSATHPDLICGKGVLIVGGSANPIQWVGGASGAWTTASNWNPQQVPGAGCTAVFPAISGGITLASETVTLEAGVLTFVCNGDVIANTSFSGAGMIVKSGEGALKLDAASSHTGGTAIVGKGTLYVLKSGALGSGKVEFHRRAGDRTQIRFEAASCEFANVFEIFGPDTPSTEFGYDFYGYNPVKLTGTIVAHDDFSLFCVYYNSPSLKNSLQINNVSAHGHTMRLYSNRSSSAAPFGFVGTIDATVMKAPHPKNADKVSDSDVFLGDTAKLSDPDASVIVSNGFLRVAAGARIAATNIVLSALMDTGTPATGLALSGPESLSSNAVVRVCSGAKIDIAANVRPVIAELYVDGVRQADRTYSSATLPNVITGTGRLRVGPKQGIFVIVR